MKYRARSRNIYYPTDDAMTLDQVLSMFEKVEEPEEIEEYIDVHDYLNSTNEQRLKTMNQLIRSVNVLVKKDKNDCR